MAVSAKLYANVNAHLANKRVNLASDTLKVTLHTSGYVPNQGSHAYQSSLTNELGTAAGYTSGGATLATVTAVLSGNTLTLDAADVVWTVPDGSTLTARYAVISDTTPGTAATNPLVAFVDFGADVTVSPVGTTGTLTVQWNVSGIATFTVA